MRSSRYLAAYFAFVFCSHVQSANCPQGGATIFYANGLNTDTGHAVGSLLNLRKGILDRLAQTGNTVSTSCLAFQLAPDFEFTESNNNILKNVNFLAQLVDAGGQQGIQLTPSLLWAWLTGTGPNPPDWFTNIVSSSVASIASTVQPDLIVQLELYRQELNAGNKVIAVAHSQGNLYVNQAYDLLSSSDKGRFEAVAVATPAPRVFAAGGAWFTLYNDIIALVPGHLAENIGNNPPSPCLTGSRVGCHDFDNSYLTGDNTRPAILDAAISAIPFSQPGKVAIGTAATLDGSVWPPTGTATVAYLIAGPQGTIIGKGIPGSNSNLPSGQYQFTYQSGGPPNSNLLGISPCTIPSATPTICNQSVSANQSFLFTLRFRSSPPTAGFTMTSGNKSATEGQTLDVAVPAGGAARVNFDSTTRSSAVNGATITQWKWSINNLVVATTAILSAQSLSPGTYTVSLMVTDSRGMQSSGVQATVNVSSGPQPVWTQSFPSTTPSAWYSTGMTYDRARSRAVLFGGIINGVGASGQTWVWDGLNWTQKFPNSSPPARQLTSTSALVYDASHQQVVLFGGLANSTFLEDTWVWDGSTWMNKTPQSPQPTPPQDSDYAMAYDAAHQRVVLYGGLHFNGSAYVGLNETWLWDGSTWSRVSPAHDPSNGRSLYAHEMAYDAAHGQVVLFGGLIGGVGASTQTWIWDGADWINKTPAAPSPSPPARSESQPMVYDSTLGAIILFDGGETWSWDGASWTHIPTTQAPSSRVNFSMTYDEGHNNVVLFGGFSNTSLNDTWLFGVGQQTMAPVAMTGRDSQMTISSLLPFLTYTQAALSSKPKSPRNLTPHSPSPFHAARN